MPTFLFFVIPLAAFGIGMIVFRFQLRRARRLRLAREPFPREWEEYLATNLPLYRKLPPELKDELHGHIHIFLDEKRFEGCAGLEVTDEMRICVAAQACMLLLNRKTRRYSKKSAATVIQQHAYCSARSRANRYGTSSTGCKVVAVRTGFPIRMLSRCLRIWKKYRLSHQRLIQ